MNLMCIEVYNKMCRYEYEYLLLLKWNFYSAVLCEGLGLGLETKEPRSQSWSRDQGIKVLVLVSRPECQGLGLGLEFFKKGLTTTLERSTCIIVKITEIHHQLFYYEPDIQQTIREH